MTAATQPIFRPRLPRSIHSGGLVATVALAVLLYYTLYWLFAVDLRVICTEWDCRDVVPAQAVVTHHTVSPIFGIGGVRYQHELRYEYEVAGKTIRQAQHSRSGAPDCMALVGGTWIFPRVGGTMPVFVHQRHPRQHSLYIHPRELFRGSLELFGTNLLFILFFVAVGVVTWICYRRRPRYSELHRKLPQQLDWSME